MKAQMQSITYIVGNKSIKVSVKFAVAGRVDGKQFYNVVCTIGVYPTESTSVYNTKLKPKLAHAVHFADKFIKQLNTGKQ